MLAGTDLLATYQIGFTDHADHVALVIDHGKGADIALGEKTDHVGNVVIRADGHDIVDHDIHRFHAALLRGAHRSTCMPER
jgi:hypothetical protein